MAFAADIMSASLTAGVFPETPIGTPEGWRPARTLRPGDRITCSAGPALRILAVEVQPPPLWAQVLPAGPWGNREDLGLPPGQRILMPLGSVLPPGLALVQAQALEGWRGVSPVANGAPSLVLRLARAAIIRASPMLYLDMPGPDGGPDDHPRPGLAEARAAIARLIAQDCGRELAQAAWGTGDG